ncbi:Interactor of constitutive active ROPs 4 [Bienertia sinuspersici]
MLVEPEVELSHCSVEVELDISEPEKSSLCDEVASRNEEMDRMRAVVEHKEKELRGVIEENEILKKQVEEANSEKDLSCRRGKEMASKVSQLEQDLEVSRVKEGQLKEKLVEAEAAKELLEIEMKKMKVQTEQWRKAADAAASVLAAGGGGVEVKGRMSERCVSLDNHYNSIFEDPPITGFGGYLGSPGAGTGDDLDDSYVGGKKKGSGIRMLGTCGKRKDINNSTLLFHEDVAFFLWVEQNGCLPFYASSMYAFLLAVKL